jgi:DNA-binding MarR family transcriptional regulator
MSDPVYPIDESIGFWVYRMRTQSVAVLKRSFRKAGYDLTPEQWGLMVRLMRSEGISQSGLGRKAYKDRHNTNRIVKQLVKRGFVEYRPDATDRRACSLFLTERGREAQKALVKVVTDHYERAFRDIPAGDLEVVKGALRRIVNNLEGIEDK